MLYLLTLPVGQLACKVSTIVIPCLLPPTVNYASAIYTHLVHLAQPRDATIMKYRTIISRSTQLQ